MTDKRILRSQGVLLTTDLEYKNSCMLNDTTFWISHHFPCYATSIEKFLENHTQITIMYAEFLEELPEFPLGLRKLQISNCPRLRKLPRVGHLKLEFLCIETRNPDLEIHPEDRSYFIEQVVRKNSFCIVNDKHVKIPRNTMTYRTEKACAIQRCFRNFLRRKYRKSLGLCKRNLHNNLVMIIEGYLLNK